MPVYNTTISSENDTHWVSITTQQEEKTPCEPFLHSESLMFRCKFEDLAVNVPFLRLLSYHWIADMVNGSYVWGKFTKWSKSEAVEHFRNYMIAMSPVHIKYANFAPDDLVEVRISNGRNLLENF